MMTGSCTPSVSPESLRTSGSLDAATVAATASSAMVRIKMPNVVTIDHDAAGVNGILKSLAFGPGQWLEEQRRCGILEWRAVYDVSGSPLSISRPDRRRGRQAWRAQHSCIWFGGARRSAA